LGNVCRATHPNSVEQQPGIRVLHDRLDRWASSRPLWNQHAYSIATSPTMARCPHETGSQADEGPNSYRQNVQGVAGASDNPDLTGAFIDGDVCRSSGGTSSLRATVATAAKKRSGGDARQLLSRRTEARHTLRPIPQARAGGRHMQVMCDVGGVVGRHHDGGNDDEARRPRQCNTANN
jgi:hypothetical protein